MPKFSAEELVQIRTAKAWRINEEDVADGAAVQVTGNIFAIVPRIGDYGKYPVVILETDEGMLAVHAFHQLLFTQLKEIKAHAGMEVVFSYAGKREKNKAESDGTKRKYHDWTVVPAEGADLDTYDFSGDDDEPGF